MCSTPLHWAANNGRFGLCKLIVEGTANKNPGTIKDAPSHENALFNRYFPLFYSVRDGSSPLHFAVHNGRSQSCLIRKPFKISFHLVNDCYLATKLQKTSSMYLLL